MRKKDAGSFWRDSENKTQLLLILALFFSCLFVFGDYLFGGSLMAFDDIGSDTWQQYVQQYATVVNHLLEGNFTFWDFNNGIGTNMLSMNLFDPSLMLVYLAGVLFGVSKMVYFLSWIHVLRVLVAGWVFYRFLSMFSFRKSIKAAMAYAYGFSGFLMVWGQHYQFGMVTIYFPLLLIFCEKYIRKEKGKAGFPVMVAISCIYSVYQTYMCLIVTGFYLIFRLWMSEGFRTGEKIRMFLLGCLQIILGIGMGCVIFLPTAYMMLNVSGRVNGVSTDWLTWLKSYLRPYPRGYYESGIMRLFSSNLQESYSLSDGRYEKFLNYYEDPVLYVSNVALVLTTQMLMTFWRTKEKLRIKAAVYTAAFLMGFTLLVPIGGCVFNAFAYSSHRYTFVLVPFILMAAAWMWEYLLQSGKRSLLGLLIILYVGERVFHLGYAQSIYPSYRTNILILAGTSLISVLIIGCYPLLKKIRAEKAAMLIMMAVLAVNAVSESRTGYSERITIWKEDAVAETMKQPETVDIEEMYDEDILEALTYLEEKDKEFYRLEKDFSSGTVSMDALAQGYCGISTYNSTLNKYFKDFISTCYPELFKEDQNHVVFRGNEEDHSLAAYMGIRYLLSESPELDSEKYVFLKQFGEIYLYENVIDTDIAHFYDMAISENSFRDLCAKGNRGQILGEVIATEDGKAVESMEELDELKQNSMADKTEITISNPEKHSEISGMVNAENDGYMLFMIPYEQGWSLEIDGQETDLFRGDLGFLACEIPEGDHEIMLTFKTPMLAAGMLISFLCCSGYVLYLYCKHKRGKKTEASA